MEKKRVRVLISGIVQGVAYRAHTKEMAKRLGVNGWVRNLPDGRVEALFEGDKDKVDQMVEWCEKGPPLARVDKVEVEEEPYRGEFFDFSIRY